METQSNPEAQFITITGICKLFEPPISRGTFWKWRRCGTFKAPEYKIGGKVFFKRTEAIQEIENHSNRQGL